MIERPQIRYPAIFTLKHLILFENILSAYLVTVLRRLEKFSDTDLIKIRPVILITYLIDVFEQHGENVSLHLNFPTIAPRSRNLISRLEYTKNIIISELEPSGLVPKSDDFELFLNEGIKIYYLCI